MADSFEGTDVNYDTGNIGEGQFNTDWANAGVDPTPWYNNILGSGMGLGGLTSLLGIPAGAAGMFGGGGSVQPQMSPQQRQMLAAQQAQLQGAQGTAGQMLPQQMGLYNQGAGLLSGMMNGQMPQGYNNLIQQAYQPFVGNITQQAIESARNRGFAGSGPQDFASGGPASQVAAPALANLPGMEANTALNLWQQLAGTAMGQGQQGLQNQMGIGQQYGQTGTSLPSGQQQNPSFTQKLGNAGNIMAGFGQLGASLPGGAYGGQQQNPQQFQQGQMAGYNPQQNQY